MGREQFSGPVDVRWLEEDERKMILLESVSFLDKYEKVWTAYQYDTIDGASIPEVLWEEVGSPYIGFYRRASVIHDVYCQRKSRPAQDVHNCFHEMMLADGVGRMKAWTMFQAVNKFGPRW